ncbi:hypothetical protein H0G72_01075 [Liberibacter sp. Z1]|nr:hypothetical protein [Candidatus Liberibacter sp.]
MRIYSFPSYAKEEDISNIHATPKTSRFPVDFSKGNKFLTPQKISFEARLTEHEKPIRNGILWNVFDVSLNKKGELSPITKISGGGQINLQLLPGNYLVSASFGHSGTVQKLNVPQTGQVKKQVLILNAGGIRLYSAYKPNKIITDDELNFAIHTLQEDPNQKTLMIVNKVNSGTLVRLNAANYQVTSHYGNYNAMVSTIVKVEAGKLLDITIQNRAAKITFKLVSEEGGEAIANTSWSISTPSGDIVGDSAGAFPSMILSEGDYVVFARNKDKTYSRDFSVVSGENTLVEVLMR